MMRGKRVNMDTWIEKNVGKLFKREDVKLIKEILSRGTTFHCNVMPECSHTWKGKPKEVYLTCPKCGKSLIDFYLRDIQWKGEKGVEVCHTTEWGQEDM